MAGYGVASKSALDIAEDLLNKRLQVLLPNFHQPSTELWLVCPSRQLITPAFRLLRDKLREKCKILLNQLIEKEIISVNPKG